jgi:prepilin-type N-terminal cleavage/methylation domain-containing protein
MRNGFTLLEMLVAIIIFALVLTGLVSIFVSGKRYIIHARSRMAGGELGKRFLDPLQMQVTQGERATAAGNGWDQANNSLRLPGVENRTWTETPENLDNINFTPTYTVSRVRDPATGNDTGLRRAKVDINWNEFAP